MAAIARSILVIAAVAVLLLTAAWPSTAQNGTCLNDLLVCTINDLNSTKPSPKCCAAINETVSTQLTCLCGLLRNPDLLKGLPFNLSQALELPKHCGVPGNTTLCSNNTSSPPPSGSGRGGSTSAPGTPPNPKGNNAAFAVTWIGTYGLMVLLALSWSIVA